MTLRPLSQGRLLTPSGGPGSRTRERLGTSAFLRELQSAPGDAELVQRRIELRQRVADIGFQDAIEIGVGLGAEPFGRSPEAGGLLPESAAP